MTEATYVGGELTDELVAEYNATGYFMTIESWAGETEEIMTFAGTTTDEWVGLWEQINTDTECQSIKILFVQHGISREIFSSKRVNGSWDNE